MRGRDRVREIFAQRVGRDGGAQLQSGLQEPGRPFFELAHLLLQRDAQQPADAGAHRVLALPAPGRIDGSQRCAFVDQRGIAGELRPPRVNEIFSGRSPKSHARIPSRSMPGSALAERELRGLSELRLSARARSRPTASSRPASSTTRKFMRKCARQLLARATDARGIGSPMRRWTKRRSARSNGLSLASRFSTLVEESAHLLRQRKKLAPHVLRQRLGCATSTFSRSRPGTSQSNGVSSSLFRRCSGTVTVTPSSGCPGSKR